MRFAVNGRDERLRELVQEHDRERAAMAETWRLVGAAAAAQGMLRPSYDVVRRLVLAHRERVRAQRAAREVVIVTASGLRTRRPRGNSRTHELLDDAQLGVTARSVRRTERTRASAGEGAVR
jgi:hypothetical protein